MIKPLKEELDASLRMIANYQKGLTKLVVTGRPWLDYLGGIIPQSILLICGASFGGKTTELENLRHNIMSTDFNEDANNYVWLSNSFEMTSFQTALRSVKKVLRKTFKDILKQEFNDDEESKVLDYYTKMTDGRFFVNNDPLPANELLVLIEDFVKAHQDKEMIFIDIDHAALIKASNDGKKGAIDDFVEGINNIKKAYTNVVFIILTQLNRGILSRIEPKSNNMAIQRSDIYQSDAMFHIADYIYGLQNPFYFKVEEYRKLSPSKYEHLSHRFTTPDKNGKVSLYTEGCLFVEILKDRTVEDFDYIDLYTIELKEFNKPEPPPDTQFPIFDNLGTFF